MIANDALIIIKILCVFNLLSIQSPAHAEGYEEPEASGDFGDNNGVDGLPGITVNFGDNKGVGGWPGINSRNYLKEKLDALGAAIDRIESVISYLVPATKKNQEELESLRQMVTTGKFSPEGNDNDKTPLNILEVKCGRDRLPANCFEVNECQTNLYSIMIPEYNDNQALPAACDLKTDNGGWTIIQRRQDGSTDFFRNWTDYSEGFGDMNGEFFIGLETLHALTMQGEPQELYIILEDFEGEQRYAKYRTVKVHSRDDDYKLEVFEYTGNAGDSFGEHSGRKFSTWDRDNDESQINCAVRHKGGWWYKSCYTSNLNGVYLHGKKYKSKTTHGVTWGNFRGVNYSLKFVQMMIRPRQD